MPLRVAAALVASRNLDLRRVASSISGRFSHHLQSPSCRPPDGGAGLIVAGRDRFDDVALPADLTEGTHYVHIRSIGCNLLPAASTASSEVKVDRTDPVSNFAGVTAGKWYKDGSVVTIGATDALSGMEPAPSDQRFDKRAHLDYSINAVSYAKPPTQDKEMSLTSNNLRSLFAVACSAVLLAPIAFADSGNTVLASAGAHAKVDANLIAASRDVRVYITLASNELAADLSRRRGAIIRTEAKRSVQGPLDRR